MGRHRRYVHLDGSVVSSQASPHEDASRSEPDRIATPVGIEAGPGTRHLPKRLRVILAATAVAGGIVVFTGGNWTPAPRTPGIAKPKPNGPAMPIPQESLAASTPVDPGTGARRTTPGDSSTPRRSASPSPTRTSAAPPGTLPTQGLLRANASVDGRSSNWAQNSVKLKSRDAMTALTLKVRITLTAGVTSTGSWSDAPGGDITITVTKQQGALLYEFALKPGATLPPGTYTFAAQYSHSGGGRNAQRDTYQATGTGHGYNAQVYGNFA